MQSVSLYIFVLIYSLIVATVYYKIEVKSSFGKMSQMFALNESNEYNKLNYLFQNLSTKTNVDFAVYNSKPGRKLSFISFMLASVFLFVLTEYGYIILLFIGFILFLPEIYIYSKKATTSLKQSFIQNIIVKKWINLATGFMYNLILNLSDKYLKLFIYNIVVLTFTFLFYLFLQKILMSHTVENLINTTILPYTVENLINTTVLYDDKPLDIISGNKLSFSGILFTLGIGGTIIFSLIDKYNEQKEIVSKNVLEIKKHYQRWFQYNKSSLNFDPSKYDEFNSAVSYLRDEFNTYVQLNNNIAKYHLTRNLIVVIYLMGIFVLIGSDWIIGFIFKLFPVVSFFLIIFIFYLFYCFKNSTFYLTEKINSSLGRNHTIYEFTDTSQENYNEKINE